MSKPKLLYASPFPPLESGISDYSVMLVDALKENFDITLFSDNYEITEESLKKYPVKKYGVDNIDLDSYDRILYNMGNNSLFHSYIYETALKHPGVVILHDLVIYHFIRNYYASSGKNIYSSLYTRFSTEDFIRYREAVRDKKTDSMELASQLPLNTELLRSGNRFITHSEYSRNKILAAGTLSPDCAVRISLIRQIADNSVTVDRDELFGKYNVPKDAVIVCSLGNIIENKLNREICHAVRDLAARSDKKICFVMVGRGNCADDELEEGFIIKTGFTELDEFNSFIRYADIIVNLRYPTLGETSGSMLRILQSGKACITNNGGWFSEIPDDCVYKIELDDVEKNLENALSELVSDKEKCRAMGDNAVKYVEAECSPETVCRKMTEFIMR